MPLTLSSWRAEPRRLSTEGGQVQINVQVAGGARDVQVIATVEGPQLDIEVPLTPGRRGTFSGTFTAPGASDDPQVYSVSLRAQDSAQSSTRVQCGVVTVAGGAMPGIAAVPATNSAAVGNELLTINSPGFTPGGGFRIADPVFQGGARVAVGDVDGDGKVDFVLGSAPVPGTSQPPHVKVFSAGSSGFTETRDFIPYGAGFQGGVRVAVGDVNGDGIADIITGAGAGAVGGHVKVFDGQSGAEIRSFFAFDPTFKGGVSVGAGDVNGDGRADIIVGAGPGAGPHVKVFSGLDQKVLASFTAYQGFAGGVFVAAADVNGDGRADIITGAGAGAAGGHVKVFDGRSGSLLRSFFAYDPAFQGGVFVAAGDLNGDGRAEIVAGPGGNGHVKVFDGTSNTVLFSEQLFSPIFTGGVEVAVWR
jgi:hypothetical protein